MKTTRKNKKTAGQLAQQSRFALAVSFLSPLKDIINAGFKTIAKQRRHLIHPFNMAMSQVLRTAIHDCEGVPTLDPGQVRLSQGSLAGVQVTDITPEKGRIIVAYKGSPLNGFWDDRVELIAYQAEVGVAIRNQMMAIRDDGQVVLTIPDELVGKRLLLYVLCHDRYNVRYSRSEYLGTYEIS